MSAPTTSNTPLWQPVLAVILGIAAFSIMDAAMKSASLLVGVLMALLLRNALATLMTLPLWLYVGRPMPSPGVACLHVQRAIVTAIMGTLFFHGLVRIPMAEGMAISFFAPIIALYFAGLILGEKIRPRAIIGACMGLVGMGIIVLDRIGAGQYGPQAIEGTIAVVLSAVLYALNLVLQRKQAMLAGPVEIAMAQNLILTILFAIALPLYWTLPTLDSLIWASLGAALATIALLCLSWGYARAEAQVLVPIEYTAFLWAALMGWLVFDETLGLGVVGGTAFIICGCWISTRKRANDA